MTTLRSAVSEPRTQLGVFVLAFFTGLVFILPHVIKYHGDERFYTDAAIRMVQTGDYWTPYFADGTTRFLKPVLTYWAVAASYAVFGISLFSSRIVFLVAGCLIVLLTYRLSLTLFRRTGRPSWRP